MSIASGVRLRQRAFVFAPVAHPDPKNPRHDPTSIPLIHHPPHPRPTISPPRLPYHPPFLGQARPPHPVRLHCLRESIVCDSFHICCYLLTCLLCPAIQDLQFSESSQSSAPSDTARRSGGASCAPDRQYAMLRPNSGLQQPHPSSPLPSASSPRPKLIFENGSVSDSGVASRTPRSYGGLDVSSAHKGRPLLDVRHPSPSSPNLSLPGYLSDSCILECSASPLHASRLDVKRLLSKPAAPSVVSALSIASDPDSESHALSRTPLNSSKAWPSKARVQAQPKPTVGPPIKSRPESPKPEQSPATPPPPLQQRPRVLRKRSTSGQHRTVLSAALRNDTSASSPLQLTTQPPAACPSHGQRPTALQSLIRSRAVVPASTPPNGSGRLTPAGAIAQAYKEQDFRREALAAAANADTILPVIPVSTSLLDSFEHATLEQNTNANVKSAPYYTGPGSSPDSFVLVDSAQDAICSEDYFSVSADKSQTRKESAPLRGQAPLEKAAARSERGHGDEGDTQTSHLRRNIDGGGQRERLLSLHKAKRKSDSFRLSLRAVLLSSDAEDSSGERSGPPAQGSSALNSTNVLAQGNGKQKVQEKGDTGAGTRLWRLVKRISTGGLRERFQVVSTPQPPVPTIPKDLLPNMTLEVLSPSDGGTDTGYSGDGRNGGMSHCIDSSDGHSPTAAHLPSGTHTSQGGGAGSRPSVSSSPQSSEPTTSIHFFRSHSSRSSFSSMVGTSPPPPPVSIHALARSTSLQTRTKNDSSSSTPGTSHDGSRRRSISPLGRSRKRSSPDIPTFSISGVVNNFVLRRPSLAPHQRRHAPAKSLPGIEPPPVGEVSGALLRRAGSEARTTMRQHRRFDPILAPVPPGQNRNSHSSDSTLRPPASAGSNAGSLGGRITFRELGSAGGQALTSQEKEDKWDDLLERSARAGGTLHLGAGSSLLASDNIRFSSSTFELET